MQSGLDPRSEKEKDPDDEAPSVDIPDNSHVLSGLLRPDADSGGDPNVCRGNGGTKFHNHIADEHHPDDATPGHARVHNGDRNASIGVLDRSSHLDTDPRADDHHNYTSDHSRNHRRPNPSGHLGVQPVPLWVRPEPRRPGWDYRSPIIADNLQTLELAKSTYG